MILIGELAAVVTAFLWSGTSLSFAEAAKRVGSVYVNVTRMALAVLYLSLTVLIFGLPLNLSFNQTLNLVISGFIGLVFGDTFLFKAFQSVGPRISMLIMSLAPPISAVLAYIFLDETLSFWGIVGITVTIAGIAIVVLQRESINGIVSKVNYIGLFYAFLGAIGQGVGLIFAKLAFNEGELNSFSATFVRLVAALVLFTPVAVLAKKYSHPIKTFLNNKKAFLFTVIGSIIGPYLGITFSMVAISHTKVGIAATLMSTMPIIMLPMVKMIYKEKLSWKSIIGAFVAVAGVAILFLR